MSMLAAIRPDSWNLPLLVHVLGAMILVGGLLTAGGASLLARRDSTGTLARLSYGTLAAVALPGFLIMRAGAAWIYDKEGFGGGGDEPAWLGIGFATADIGGLLLLIALVLGGIGLARARRGGGDGLLRASGMIALVLLVAYVVTVWAMAGKPA
jgi:hypothetical protein